MTKTVKIAIICSACAIPVIAVSVAVPLVIKNNTNLEVKTIEIDTLPSKTWYLKDEKLTLSGLKVKALMSNNTYQELGADQYTTSIPQGTVLETVNDKTVIEVYYKTKTKVVKEIKTSFEVKVGPILTVEQPTKLIYQGGDALDLTGLKVTAHFSSSEERVLNADEYSVSPANGTILQPKEGNLQQITVTYLAKPEIIDDNTYVIVGSSPKNFADASWEEIAGWCSIYEYARGSTYEPEISIEFLRHFKKTDINDFLGEEHDILINNQTTQKVRIIGLEHDTIFDGVLAGRKALFTFQFANQVLTNSEGVAYTSVYDSKVTCKDYTNSVLKNNLYNIDPEYKATWKNMPEETKTVFQMFPQDLQNGLKTVRKEVYCQDSAHTQNYNPKVFILSRQEFAGSVTTFMDRGSQYTYWKGKDESARIAKTAGSSPVAANYATSSSRVNQWMFRCLITDSGVYNDRYAVTNASAVVPCFSI